MAQEQYVFAVEAEDKAEASLGAVALAGHQMRAHSHMQCRAQFSL